MQVRWQGQSSHGFLRVADKAGQVAAIDRNLNAGKARTLLVIHTNRSVHRPDIGQGMGRPDTTIGCRQLHILERFGAVAHGVVAFEGQRCAHTVLQHITQGFTLDLVFERLLE